MSDVTGGAGSGAGAGAGASTTADGDWSDESVNALVTQCKQRWF